MLYSFQLSLNNEGNINQKTKVWNFKQVYILRNLKYTTFKNVIKLLYLLDASPRKVEKKYYKEQRITINYVHTVVCIKVRTASFPRFWKNHP